MERECGDNHCVDWLDKHYQFSCAEGYFCVMLFNPMHISEEEAIARREDADIFHRLKSGNPIRLNDPEYSKIQAVVDRTIPLHHPAFLLRK